MTTIKLSPNSLGHYNVCRRFHWYYKILGRRAVRTTVGRIAGSAVHDALKVFNSGGAVPDQEAAIDKVLQETPVPTDDYRSASFLRDALAAYRAELGGMLSGWTVEEVEAHGEVELGQVSYRLPSGEQAMAHVLFEFRRDLVALSPDGLRAVFDYKTASRNEEVEWQASKNSGALMAYARTYEIQHGKPVHGACLVRIIMRKPSKSGVAFEFPRDGMIYFPKERLDEWQRQTLRTAKEILERDPNDPDAWPLSSNTLGCCRHQYGACDFLPVCTLPLADRLTMLNTDAFEEARRNADVPQPGDEP